MSTFVFVNNFSTTLAAALTSTATTVTLASSTGLPTLASGQIMPLTLNDAATGQIYEILYVTAISGATLTIERAQEGTAAQAWAIGDYAKCMPTAQSVEPSGGNPAQTFQVASASANNQAINLGQAQAYFAALNGSSSEAFNVANGTSTNEAINFSQVVGIGQSIASFSASLNTTYVNGGTKPIHIYANTVYSSSHTCNGLINGSLVVSSSTTQGSTGVTLFVMPGETWEITDSVAGSTLAVYIQS